MFSKNLKLYSTILLISFITACSHIPLATQYKLATLDKEKINPAISQYAFRMPNNTAFAKHSPIFTIKVKAVGDYKAINQTFVLEKIKGPIQSKFLLSKNKNGHHIDVYEFSSKDKKTLTKTHKIAKEIRKKHPEVKNKNSFGVNFTLCTLTNVKFDQALIDSYVKLSPDKNFFTLATKVNYGKMIKKGGYPDVDISGPLPKCK